jgi:hypothetical protein
MADAAPKPARKRGNSKPNVKRRGDTYTYYLYVTDHLGNRKQHTKGGFKTQRDAEEARIAALASIQTGSYVKAEKQTVAEYLLEDWLPSRKPPSSKNRPGSPTTGMCAYMCSRGSASSRFNSSPPSI